jgi:hypothetical protein
MALAISNPITPVLKNKLGKTQSADALAYAFLTSRR